MSKINEKRELKEGDRVHVPGRKNSVGTIDEVWRSDDVQGGALMASVVWDISGCVGEDLLSELELWEG